jgi:hypothetical protein
MDTENDRFGMGTTMSPVTMVVQTTANVANHGRSFGFVGQSHNRLDELGSMDRDGTRECDARIILGAEDPSDAAKNPPVTTSNQCFQYCTAYKDSGMVPAWRTIVA